MRLARNVSFQSIRSIIVAALVAYTLLGLCFGNLRLFSKSGLLIVSDYWWLGTAGLIIVSAIVTLLLETRNGKTKERWVSYQTHLQWVALFAITALFFSDVVFRRFTFFVGPQIRGVMIFAGALLFLFFLSRRHESFLSRPRTLLLVIQALVIAIFLRYADGRLIFSDDHPSFLYRLILLYEHFPYIPFYNLDWNAGYSAREFFPSGVLNVFFLSWPWMVLFGVISTLKEAAIYTYLIPYLYILIVPWSIFAACKMFRFTDEVAFFGALFSLCPSLTFFEWMLKYGTIGFALSAGLLPLTFALSYRLALDAELPEWKHVLVLLLVSFLCLTWTLSAAVLLPIVLVSFIRFRHTFKVGRREKVIAFALLFAIINGPWIYTFANESKVGQFLSGDSLPGSHASGFVSQRGIGKGKAEPSELERSLSEFRRLVVKMNPLFVLFFLPGLFLIRDREQRLCIALTLAWLVLLASAGERLKPQLELRRMIVPAAFLMGILSALSISSLLRTCADGISETGVSARSKIGFGLCAVVLLGVTAMAPVTAGAVYHNRSDERFIFQPPKIEKLVKVLKKLEKDGRVFFVGFILHELGAKSYKSQDGGHIAPLPSFTGNHYYAFDYYHSRWSSIDPIPAQFRKRGVEGIEEFLDLVNATHVVTFRREWRDYCRSLPHYSQIEKVGRFRVFRRERPNPTYFLEGDGEIKKRKEGFTVVPNTDEVVLKFRYHHRLRASHPEEVELFRHPVFEEELGGGKSQEVSFIGLRVSEELIAAKTPIEIGFWVD